MYGESVQLRGRFRESRTAATTDRWKVGGTLGCRQLSIWAAFACGASVSVPASRSIDARTTGIRRRRDSCMPVSNRIRDDNNVLRYASIVLLALTACNRATAPGPAAESHAVVVFGHGATLAVRVADTPEKRATGLMHVMALPANDGMAFVYAEPSTETYWMKDTLIPL